MQIGLSSLVASSDEALGGAIGQEAFDFRPVRIKLTFAGSSWAPELHALRLAEAEGFGGPLGDQLSLNLCRHRERHRHNLALNAVIEVPVALDGVDADALLGRDGENLHTLQHTAAQS